MKTGSTVMRVVEHPGGGWDIREPGRTEPVMHAADPEEAVREAGTMMLHGGAVWVVNREGFVVETRPVPGPGGPKPWWYLPPRSLFRVFGEVFLLQGVLGIIIHWDEALSWMYLLMALLGVAYLVILLVSARHDRRLPSET